MMSYAFSGSDNTDPEVSWDWALGVENKIRNE